MPDYLAFTETQVQTLFALAFRKEWNKRLNLVESDPEHLLISARLSPRKARAMESSRRLIRTYGGIVNIERGNYRSALPEREAAWS